MYSANLDDNRVTVQCNILNDHRLKFIDAIYDTGARYTCFQAYLLDSNLLEDGFSDYESKLLSGFVGNDASRFYRFPIERFAFGNIDIGKQDIWITFDERVTSNVVGYDIIKQITRASIAGSDRECFFMNVSELKDYISKL